MEIAPGDQAAPSVRSRGVRDDAAAVVVMRRAGRRSDRRVGGRTSQKFDRGARAHDVAAVARDASADPTAARSGLAALRRPGDGEDLQSPVAAGEATVRISADVDHLFRSMSIARSGDGDQVFRLMSITR
jgi:hypothetical protein